MSALIADKTFDLIYAKEYILSIQVSLDGFYFSIIHNNRLLALKKSPVKISSGKFLGRRFSEWLSTNKIFEKDFKEVRIIYFSDKITAIPGDYYNYDKQDELINRLFGKQSGYKAYDNYWPANRCNLVFSINEQFLKEAAQKFSDFKIIHPVTVLNDRIQSQLKENTIFITLYFYKNSFFTILYSGKELKSVNCYNYTNSDDAAFYLFSLLSANNIVYKEANLIVAGDIETYNNICGKLSSHTGTISFVKPEVSFNIHTFPEPMYRFITIV